MRVALRCYWRVSGGIIPGVEVPKYTRRWEMTSDIWEAENAMSEEEFKAAHPDGKSTFWKQREEAYAYAASLSNPNALNWVRVDWIWI
jgi:hypothetical protein